MSERDLAMMYAAHDAFRRDLRELAAAPDRERWTQFRTQLSVHHTAEDVVLWPSLRRRGVDARLVEAMAAEHDRIDPLLAQVDRAFDTAGPDAAQPALAALSELLHNHLQHEEKETLPLINDREWSLLDREMRRRIGLRGLRAYYSWLLRDLEGERRRRALATIPGPLRLMIS
ncbi:hemerythrin domain-containing protein [Nocardia sp. XZ_19_385]|uniref:hemerythrin domain-containing protein n=1 Tax=Nocardia sp. XZ_19_385 TaxID=2769488 RepID=UPI00188E7ADF|nr:hemerythrin domain-containing protein [Nocardia sp. XZ_19_385]